ncbi:MAG: hypothetical protein JWP44_2463 [Mucilaginibacter sp.]|nr:hypothetical protein [Mucilaginibacter sp.]
MNTIRIYQIVIISILMLTSCENRSTILAVKNATKSTIVGASLLDDSVSDSEIYGDSVYMEIYLKSGEVEGVGMVNFRFNNQSDTSKLQLFIFNEDSLKKFRRLGVEKGIISKCLIKKMTIPLKTIKKIDTIIIR